MTTMAAPGRVLQVTEADIGRMRDQLFFEGPEEGRVPRAKVLLPGDASR